MLWVVTGKADCEIEWSKRGGLANSKMNDKTSEKSYNST